MSALKAVLQWPTMPEDDLGIALWTAGEIAAATGGSASVDFAVSGCEIDSREVHEGDLFFALKGESSDGHRFVEGAIGRGAAAAIVDRPVDGLHVLVDNTSRALEDLGKAARSRVDAAIIGVTGSAGKTGVKEALYAALDRGSRGRAHRSVKSYNNHVGVPLSLARMPVRTKFGVFEMGMNHAGELADLTRLVRPHVAIVTTIAPAHIGHFSGEEAIADAKAEIFEGLEQLGGGTADGKGGVAIIPADNPHCARLRAKAVQHAAKVISFGFAADADIRVLDAVPAPGGGTLVTADMGDRRLCYKIAMPGEHWVANSLAVMAAVREVGGDLGAAGLALAEMEGLAGRGARQNVTASGGDGSGEALLIDESYNANPASMRVTIRQLGETRARQRLAVLGAMKELGDFEARFHADLAVPLLAAKVDRVIMVGPEMASLAATLGKTPAGELAAGFAMAHVDNAVEAVELLTGPKASQWYGAGDAILVKGSNSVGLGAVVRALSARET